MSNQPKICPTCQTSNPGSAQYCAACGTVLASGPTNPILKYPKLKLQPTSLYNWRFIAPYPLLILIAPFVFFILYCIVAIWAYDFYGNDPWYYCNDSIFKIIHTTSYMGSWAEAYHEYKEIISISLVLLTIGLIILLIPFTKGIKQLKYTKANPLTTLADYIQSYRYGKKYVLFIKNGKFGVMNVTEFKVAIPAQYDEIAWREPNRILTVTKGSETYDIDIFGNQLR